MDIKEVYLKGSPYEIGLQHGKECGTQIERSIKTYSARYMKTKGLSWEAAQEFALEFMPVLENGCARYLEEMHGIADGSGHKFEEILALNLRSEILYTGLSPASNTVKECTAFSAVEPAAQEGTVLAGQTWDFNIAQREASFMAHIDMGEGLPKLLLLLEGGMVGGKGISSNGLCLTINALSTKDAVIGIPLHVRMRAALEAPTLTEACTRLMKAPIPSASCIMLTHRDGISLGFELDPSGVDVIQPENGVIVHTNHFIGPKLMMNHSNASSGSTYIRYQRMKRLMTSKSELTVSDIEGFLRDHKGFPSSVCAHPAPGTPKEQLLMSGATNYAFVAELVSLRFRFVMGNPCEGEFKDYTI